MRLTRELPTDTLYRVVEAEELLDEGIDHVFDKYGDTPLAELLAELGIGREDMIEEALRFGPSVLVTLDERGYLDTVVRRRLAPFYASDAFRAAVADTR